MPPLLQLESRYQFHFGNKISSELKANKQSEVALMAWGTLKMALYLPLVFTIRFKGIYHGFFETILIKVFRKLMINSQIISYWTGYFQNKLFQGSIEKLRILVAKMKNGSRETWLVSEEVSFKAIILVIFFALLDDPVSWIMIEAKWEFQAYLSAAPSTFRAKYRLMFNNLSSTNVCVSLPCCTYKITFCDNIQMLFRKLSRASGIRYSKHSWFFN